MQNTYQAAIDFDPGMHGHFLEYICNKYIFNVPVSSSPFFKTGSAHAINLDVKYQADKQVVANHYTYNNTSPSASKVIFIKHNPKFDLVLLSNVIHRCYGVVGNFNDVDPEHVIDWHLNLIKRDNTTELANVIKENIYAKLTERTHFQPDVVIHRYNGEIFNFDFGSFFNLTEFLIEIQNLAKFCNQMLIVPKELISDYKMFIDKNQGYQIYQRVNYLVEKILSNEAEQIEDDFLVHTGINVYLARIARLHDTELHSASSYPTNTQDIFRILTTHFIEYDTKYP